MTKKQLLSYGLLGFSKDLLMAFSGGLLMYYFTDGLQFSAILVGEILFFGRLFDAFCDIFVGYFLGYRANSYKKWYLVGIISSVVVLSSLFSLGIAPIPFLVPLLVVLYLLLGTTYTFMDVSYWSMLPKLSKDNQTATLLSTVATFFSSGAALLGFSVALPLLNLLGKDHLTVSFSRLALLLSLLVILILIFAYSQLPDSSVSEESREKQEKPLSIVASYANVLKNRSFLKYLLYFFFFQLSFEWMNNFNIYYFKYSINQEYFYSFYAFTILAQIAATLLYSKWNKRLTRTQLFYLSALLSISGMVCLFVFGQLAPSNLVLMFIAASIKQMGSGLFMVSATSDLAVVIRQNHTETGSDTPALFTSVKLLSAKFTTAVTGLGVGFSLSLIGYVHNSIQTSQTALSIGIAALIFPCLLVLISSLFYRYFNHDMMKMTNQNEQL